MQYLRSLKLREGLVDLVQRLDGNAFHSLVHGNKIGLLFSPDIHTGLIVAADPVEPAEVINTGSQNDVQRCYALLVAYILTDQRLLVICGGNDIEGLGGKILDDDTGTLNIFLHSGDAKEYGVPGTDGGEVVLLCFVVFRIRQSSFCFDGGEEKDDWIFWKSIDKTD